MEIDCDKLLENALRDGIREGIKSKLQASYNNPLDTLIVECLRQHSGKFSELLKECLSSCFNDADFRKGIADGVRHTLAKVLVARFGGELEKQINALKSDPATRARITLAIEEIVKSKVS